MSDELAEQHYWDSSYKNLVLGTLPKTDVLRNWIQTFFDRLPPGQSKTAIEIGCFPGQYLSVFGELGYELQGIDRTPRVEIDLPNHLKANGFSTGEFIRDDFLTYSFDRQYDVVTSFGFIEHFQNWENVLLKHACLVKPGGHLVIETPNFRGTIQRTLHWLVDRENLARHNLEAMQFQGWADLLKAEGFEIIFCGCFGRFAFWADNQQRNIFQRATLVLLEHCVPFVSQILPRDVVAYSPYCGLIARRRDNQPNE